MPPTEQLPSPQPLPSAHQGSSHLGKQKLPVCGPDSGRSLQLSGCKVEQVGARGWRLVNHRAVGLWAASAWRLAGLRLRWACTALHIACGGFDACPPLLIVEIRGRPGGAAWRGAHGSSWQARLLLCTTADRAGSNHQPTNSATPSTAVTSSPLQRSIRGGPRPPGCRASSWRPAAGRTGAVNGCEELPTALAQACTSSNKTICNGNNEGSHPLAL